MKYFGTLVLTLTLLASAAGSAWATPAAQISDDRSNDSLVLIVQERPIIVNDSFVAPLVDLFGEIYIGKNSFIAGNTELRAAPGLRVDIYDNTNLQDNIVVRSRDDSVEIGNETSIAHHAIVRDSKLGDFTFVGFNAQIMDSVIGDGAFVLHGAYVEGVTVHENRIVGVGQVVLTQAEADALPEAPESTVEFRREVLEVNEEFAESYIDLYNDEGYDSVVDVGPNPITTFNPDRVEPQIGDNTVVQEFARVVGDVRIGADSQIGQRSAIRADEGAPIILGSEADLDDRVTFHALSGTDISVGDRLTSEDDVVFHGPLIMGDDVSAGDDSVVFRVNVGNNVKIGERAYIVGPAVEEGEELLQIPAGTVIPDEAVITSAEDLQDVLNGGDGSRDEDRDKIGSPGMPNTGAGGTYR